MLVQAAVLPWPRAAILTAILKKNKVGEDAVTAKTRQGNLSDQITHGMASSQGSPYGTGATSLGSSLEFDHLRPEPVRRW